jgi:magnesium-transporting ATPase (P-type)
MQGCGPMSPVPPGERFGDISNHGRHHWRIEPMTVDAPHWHARTAHDALADQATGTDGLSEADAAERLVRFGPNRLTPPRRRSVLARFAAQFNNILIYVLLAAAGVSLLLGETVDAAVIAGVVAINAIIGFVQEGRAEQALKAIRDMLSPQASVLREGRRRAIPAEELVPGDLVFLQSGDKVPGDLRLIQVRNLQIQEAALTGESMPAQKSTDPVPADVALGDRTSMSYSGTLVATGQGLGLVVATGDATEIGRISRMLAEVETLTTPLLAKMTVFGRWLTLAILVLSAAAFAFGVLLRDYPLSETFMAAVGIAVAAIPEGLPAVMTITLAIGVTRMARRNAIIRRLPAVETLGSVSVICSDKTGTLTRNELTVQSIATAGQGYTVTGIGYRPVGEFRLNDGSHDSSPVDPRTDLVLFELARAALLCNDAALAEDGDDWTIDGDPTDGALLTLAHKAALDASAERANRPRLDVIPFESEHKFMATLHGGTEGALIYVKGAPEQLLEMCRDERHADSAASLSDVPLDAEAWRERIQSLARQGQRVLGIATRPADPGQTDLQFDHITDGLILLGIVGLIDPPREEAVAAVRACTEAGIRVKMITGDHAETARAIGAAFGLGANGAVTGRDLDALDDVALADLAERTDVFARTTPEHKLRLVKALQARGNTVAMTGDGVNDAPALKRADIGIAMGRKGTEAAKEAAAMVLADDNFASIARAVEEGRTVYDNLRKTILFLLPTNGAQALIILAAILMGQVLPITPVQILWVNMISAVTLGLALAFEPPEADAMRRPPRAPDEPILTRYMIVRMSFVMLVLVVASFGLFLYEETAGADRAYARTVAVNTVVMGEIFYLWNARAIFRPVTTVRGIFGNRPVLLSIALALVFQLALTYLPILQQLFGTAALGPGAWLLMTAAGLSLFVLVELEKALARRFLSSAG